LIWLRRANLALALLAMLTPLAHLLELPNKFSLDAPLWLAVQQHLYRGWGPILAGPAEIGAFASTLFLAHLRRRGGRVLLLTVIGRVGYAGMLAAFVVLNAPVNVAVSLWTSLTIPSDWTSYRIRWETGHGIAAVLSVISWAVLAWAYRIEERL
jgi:hypothetical protein